MLFTHAHAERRLGALLLAAALGLSSAFSSAASAAAPAQSADPAPLFELEILHTNDTHAFAAGLMTAADAEAIAGRIRAAGYDVSTRRQAEQFLDRAREALLCLPDRPERALMLQMADYVRDRKK